VIGNFPAQKAPILTVKSGETVRKDRPAPFWYVPGR